ncbi:MAG TPA: hypothetical protein VLV32_00050 [Burkholderiales bacterium]|nr:hypothetical protein [Burkholderiales bacterium]
MSKSILNVRRIRQNRIGEFRCFLESLDKADFVRPLGAVPVGSKSW